MDCAIGLARHEGRQTADALYSAADAALLAAMERTDGAPVDAAVGGVEVQSRLQLVDELDRAIREQELVPFYQARVAADGRIGSLEALVRWRHPSRGVLSPGAFIEVAETSGRVVRLGRLMLDLAARQATAWRDRDVTVSVNVAARQFADGALVADVEHVLRRYGLAPQRLELEITESALLLDLDHALAQLQALRGLGVQLALDDFGTGYSSLSYLTQLPVHRLKIDRSFVNQLDIERVELTVRSIIALAHGLGLAVTAEGVETAAQAAALRAMGCDELQGFLYARPVPAEAVDWQGQASLAEV